MKIEKKKINDKLNESLNKGLNLPLLDLSTEDEVKFNSINRILEISKRG